MEIVLLPPLKPNLCAPISHAMRPFSECLIANRTIREWATKQLVKMGYNVVETPLNSQRCIRLTLDHDFDVSVLSLLAKTERSTVLFDKLGNVIAWKGVDHYSQAESHEQTEIPVKRISYPWDMLRMNAEIVGAMDTTEIKGEVSSMAHINGHLRLGKGSEILPGVMIEGNVVIGDHCRIGPNCFIRGNTSIGDHCIIGNAVEVKNSIIYPHSTIAHLSFVGDSIVGAHVNLGAGTIISNFRHDGKNHKMMVDGALLDTGVQKLGAMIGDGVHTGIHTSIYPGRKIGMGRTTAPGTVVQHDLM